MFIEFTKTGWLKIDPYDVRRIDIDSVSCSDLTENAAYYVRITLKNGDELTSDYFKTLDEARACAENLIRALSKED